LIRDQRAAGWPGRIWPPAAGDTVKAGTDLANDRAVGLADHEERPEPTRLPRAGPGHQLHDLQRELGRIAGGQDDTLGDRPSSRASATSRPIAVTERLLAEDERGFIGDHQLQRGTPPDAPQLVPVVGRVIAVTGRAPGTVVGDRGFGTAANDQALEALGVKRVGLQRTGTPGKAGLGTGGR
jgi:hypothetical protein